MKHSFRHLSSCVAVLAPILLACTHAVAQDSTKQNALTVSGYIELYYSRTVNNPPGNAKPGFVFSHNRNNEVNLNLGYLRAGYATGNLRAALTLAAGTYVNANYAAEPGVLRNVYEASAGIKLSAKREFWLDAGIFPAHTGFETAVGKDCWTLTRSVFGESSPYYESGVKLGYTTPNTKWYLSGLLLNGWQHIARPAGNTTPAFGWQVYFKPSDRLLINSSSFAGSDHPDSARLMRYFHDFYGVWQINKQWGLTAGFDYGIEQQAPGSSRFNRWYAPILLVRMTPDDKNRIAGKMEYYHDAKEVIVATGTPDGFVSWGWSLNYDRAISGSVLARVEVRRLDGKDGYFERRNREFSASDTWITASLAVSF